MESCMQFRSTSSGHGWRNNESLMSSISTLPLHLIAIFVIVVLLLYFSSHADYKAQAERNFQFVIYLLPLLIMFLVGFLFMNGGLYSQLFSHSKKLGSQSTAVYQTAASFPWGVMVLVVVVLVLLSYQSSFQSKWFGPFSRSE